MKIYIFLSVMFLQCQAQTCKKNEVCHNGHPGIIVVNNSSKKINYEIYWNYPDTLIGDYNPVNDGTGGISPSKSFTRGAGRKSCWEELFADGKKEWVYFFDQDTISKLDWNKVRQTNRGLLERRLIDLSYLQQHDFKIIYQ
jgi:hypothetical protein